jgi:hypothetical protein
MPKTELLDQSAPRAELDRRSREARLRLEQVERLLVLHPLRRPSLLRRVVHCLRSRIYVGVQTRDRSLSGTHPGRGPLAPGETSSAAGRFPAASPAAWSHCTSRARMSLVHSDAPGFKPW